MLRRLGIFLGVLTAFVFPVAAFAQDDYRQAQSSEAEMPVESAGAPLPIKIAPPMTYPETQLPFGQSHFYSITLRGNGEALFSLKAVFSNKNEEASMSAVTFTFPGEPQSLRVYQAYREPQCISYKPISPRPLQQEQNDLMLRYPYPLPRQECEQYQEPDYSYGWGTTTYHNAEFSLNERELMVVLPKPVKPGGSGSLVLSFLLSGMTSKDFLGAYDFSVKTVMVADTIQNLQAGITVDPDYYLKDAKGVINYQSKEMSSMAPAAVGMDSGRSVVNAQFDQFYNSIGQGTVVKNATNLQPNESYSVNGTYADSRWKLYGREIGIGIGVFVLILILVVGLFYFVVKKIFTKRNTTSDKPASSSSSYLIVFGASFGSSLLIFLYSIGLYFISYYSSQMFPYYSDNFFYPMFILLLGVISLCIYSALLFAPSIVIGIKRGVVASSATLILTIVWLVFFGIVFAGIFFLFFQDKPMSPGYPVPYRGGVFMEKGAAASSEPAVDQ
jgi:hypothetical protein